MKKKLFAIFFAAAVLLFSPTNAWAAKKRLSRGEVQTSTRKTYAPTQGAITNVRLKPDRRGLLIKFSSFGEAASVTYTLTYTGNGVSQGVMGTVSPEATGEEREVLFGTCSAGVCRYHRNIQNARLTIDSKLKSGAVLRKPYRIKI